MLRIAAALLCWMGFLSPVLAQQVFNPRDSSIVCGYNSSLPVLASGTYGLVQCNNNGALFITNSATSPLSVASALSAPVALTPSDSVTFTALKTGVHIDVTVPGNVKIGWPNGTTATVYFAAIGPYDRAWLINQIFVTGTTATFTAIGQ